MSFTRRSLSPLPCRVEVMPGNGRQRLRRPFNETCVPTATPRSGASEQAVPTATLQSDARAHAMRPYHQQVIILVMAHRDRAMVCRDCATRTGGRSKQRSYHEGVMVHGPTDRGMPAWSRTARDMDGCRADQGRTNRFGRLRTPLAHHPAGRLTARRVASWRLKVRPIDVRLAGQGRIAGPVGHRRLSCLTKLPR
jgi:hypothetical protein